MGSGKKWKYAIGGGVSAILLVGLLAFAGVFDSMGGQAFTVTTPSGEQTTVSPEPVVVVGGQCPYDGVTPTYVTRDEYNKGTTVGSTAWVKKNGYYESGVTELDPNTKISLLLINSTTFHSAYVESFDVPCAPTVSISKTLLENATVDVKVFNTNGDVVSTGATGGENETGATDGESFVHKIILTGEDEAGTNDMTCVFEASNKNNISDIVLSGNGATEINSVPKIYNLDSGNSELFIYDINAINGASSIDMTATVLSESGNSMANSNVSVTCYTKEWFLNSKGVPTYAIEDVTASGNSPQWMGLYTATWYYKS